VFFIIVLFILLVATAMQITTQRYYEILGRYE